MIDGVMKANNFSLTAYVLITLAKSVRVTGVSESQDLVTVFLSKWTVDST